MLSYNQILKNLDAEIKKASIKMKKNSLIAKRIFNIKKIIYT